MAENKTTENKASIPAFLKKIKIQKKREDCSSLIDLLTKHTGMQAKMWGTGIVGFGSYHYKYESGREGDSPLVAIAPRSSSIVLYLTCAKEKPELLKKLGKYKMSGGCVHIQKIDDIDTKTLTKLVDNSIKELKKKYPDK